jgi:hypothetical protein
VAFSWVQGSLLYGFLDWYLEWLFEVLADATAADHSHWKFLPLKPVNFFWKYPTFPCLPPKEKAFLLLVSQKVKLKMLKSSAFLDFQ